MQKEIKITRSLFIDIHTLMLMLKDCEPQGELKEMCEKIEKQLLEKHEAMARRAAYGKVKYGETDEIREMAFLEYSEMLARRTKRMPEQAREATDQALRNMLEKGKPPMQDNGA